MIEVPYLCIATRVELRRDVSLFISLILTSSTYINMKAGLTF